MPGMIEMFARALPPPTGIATLDEAFEALGSRRRELVQARQTLEQLTGRRSEAHRHDVQAVAGALGGSRKKVELAGAALEEEIANAHRKAQALQLLVKRAFEAVRSLLAENRESYRAAIGERLLEVEGELLAAAEAWAGLRRERDSILGLTAWLDGFPRRSFRPVSRGLPVERLTGFDGIVDAMREDATGEGRRLQELSRSRPAAAAGDPRYEEASA